MKSTWFKRLGWFYVPVSLPGAVITLVAVVFFAEVFLAIDRKSHSVSDTFYGVFPYFASCFLLVDWIAARSGGHPGKEN